MERIMFISHATPTCSYFDGICFALKGGIKLIQLRMKKAKIDDIIAIAQKAKAECKKNNATLLINDCVELVNYCGFDGVHLGKDDMSPAKARALLGKDIIIGATANTAEDIIRAVEDEVDYVGLGPFAYTATKQKLSPVLDIAGYRNIILELHNSNIKIPIYAIGGITLRDIKPLMDTGIYGIAISGAVLSAADPITMAQEFISSV